MHIILGGTGHVGSAVADALLEHGEPVTVVTREAARAEEHRRRGATIAVVDVLDTDALREVFRGGRRAFLLNPPADPTTDTIAAERRTVASIVAALDGSGLERVVAQSTYGAQPGEGLGDLGLLHELERALAAQAVPASVVRAAYHFSNWEASLESAREEGVVHTLYPPGFGLPMVAPRDIGRFAARLMTGPTGRRGVHHVEGPMTYSAADVAAAFGRALDRDVRAIEIPRERWVATMRDLGFSVEAAPSFAAMTAVTLEERYDRPDAPERGHTALQAYVDELVRDDGEGR